MQADWLADASLQQARKGCQRVEPFLSPSHHQASARGYISLLSKHMRRRILLAILLAAVLVPVCALVMMWFPLPPSFPPPFSGERDLMSAVGTGILGIGYLIVLATYVIGSVRQAGYVLGSQIAATGLRSEDILLFGRRYQGIVRGRGVEATVFPPYGLSRALLNVYVSADLGTRMAVSRGKPLLDCSICPRVDVGGDDLRGYHVYAQDEERARWLLADTESRAALIRLLDGSGDRGLWELYLQPDRIWLRARPAATADGQFQGLLDALLVPADRGEKPPL